MNFELEPAQQTWRRRSSGKAAGAGGAARGGACGAVQRRSTSLAVLALGLAALSCLFGYCVLSESAPHDARTLRLVLLIFRHGARNPTTSYNSDPYKNYNWPDGLGSLTNVGKLQLYELGKRFRSYYGNFLSDEYLEKDAYVMSSDHSRCLMSAYTLLAGLYPPVGRHIWHPDIGWQPIPVHSIPRQYDKMIAAKKVCKTVDEQYDRVSRLVNSRPEYAELFDYLSKHTNQSMRSVLQVEFLFSALQIEQDAGLKLPEWTKNVYPDKIEDIAKTSLAMFTYNDMMKRLRAGPLLDDVMSKLRHKVAGTLSPDRSLFLYSSHDITIVNLWRALGFEELLRPEYGASIVLELHQEPEGLEHHVKALYWNNTKVDSPLELKLPLCNEPCTIRDFQLSLQHLIPDDWEAECNK